MSAATVIRYLTDPRYRVKDLKPPHKGSVGIVLRAAESRLIKPSTIVHVPTGIQFDLPSDGFLLVTNYHRLNPYLDIRMTIVEPGDAKSISVPIWNISPDQAQHVNMGEEIAQAILLPYYESQLVRVTNPKLEPIQTWEEKRTVFAFIRQLAGVK